MFLAFENMKIQLDKCHRIIIPPEIRGNFSDSYAYFGISPDGAYLEVMPATYVRVMAKEYERLHGKHRMGNKSVRLVYRKFFSAIYDRKVAKNYRIVIPLQVRKQFGITDQKELEARVVEERLIIDRAAQ